MNYYYSIDGTEVVGPYSLDDLKGYFFTGSLPPTTQVCAEKTETWQLLGSLVEPPKLPPHPLPLRQAQVRRDEQIPNHDTSTTTYTMKGVQDLLEVYSDKVSITPQGVLGFLNKGFKGTKTIPFTSIIAIQFKEAGLLWSGFIQFTIPGGNESRGGLLAATKDENTFMFAAADGGNELALKIKTYIEAEVQKLRTSPSATPSSLSDELQKLAGLKAQGILSDSEFNAAKKRLLCNSTERA